jgi:hypothetical protein
MANFGLYEVGSLKNPREEYEGVYLTVNGDCVSVWANVGDGTGDKVFAVIRLAQGQSVKIVKEQR